MITEKNIDFVAMVDEKYASPLFTSINQALKFYPHTKYYVYDCGLSAETVQKLSNISPQVKIITWELKYLPVHIKYNKKFLRIKTNGMMRDVFKNFFSKEVTDKSLRSFIAQQDFEIKIQNKLAIIKHHNDTVQRPFVFIDADAFIIKDFNELLNSEHDIAFTLRPISEHRYGHNQCSLLFAGIFWFTGPYQTLQVFIDRWYEESRKINEINSEQTSLARWLHRLEPTIYNSIDTEHVLTLDDTQHTMVNIRILDAEKYNNTNIDNFDLKEALKNITVLHFKNSRFETPQFEKIATELQIET